MLAARAIYRSAGLKVEESRYSLQQQLEVPYYQPLPRHLRNPQGDYPLTPAGNRFWSKMNFPQRPQSNIQRLDQKISVAEKNGAFELTFDVTGHDREVGAAEQLRPSQPEAAAPPP